MSRRTRGSPAQRWAGRRDVSGPHLVSGDEAFVVHRSVDGDVWFTLRSLTQSPSGQWRAVYQVALVVQLFFRRRYRRALRVARIR